MTEKELEKVKALEGENESLKKEIGELQELLLKAQAQIEEITISQTAAQKGEYAELYEEDGKEYIIGVPYIWDIKKQEKTLTRQYFANNKGEAARLSEGGSTIVKRKEEK